MPPGQYHSIIQWNCRGIKDRKEEIQKIVESHTPEMFAIQKTMLQNID